MNKIFKKRNFLKTDPIQTRFLFLLCSSMLLSVSLVGSFLYFLIFKILAEQNTPSGYAVYDLYPVIMRINLAIIFGFLPLFLLLLALGIMLSNRLTGPLQRIQREIREITESGDFKKRLFVRKGDYLKTFIDSVNELLNKVNEIAQK